MQLGGGQDCHIFMNPNSVVGPYGFNGKFFQVC